MQIPIDYRKSLSTSFESGMINMLINSANDAKVKDPKYCTFGGPFTGNHRRMHDIPCGVPEAYRVSVLSKLPDPTGKINTLATFKETRYSDEVLFHMFYNFCGESYQIVASMELYRRGWRYHMQQNLWLG
ncbi:hypothetical protein L596_026268 [Steinernema carpocapsae]|uniref:NOT2/NOT3/NOT5 C-terminal domain-containing protein n=1 Tax=Steinernema carpocapsae TaxID=34508 RepID=A0A4U5M1U9_STECR|nr:hypothetical protein L596_026268 [Steinernema carpocapsae]